MESSGRTGNAKRRGGGPRRVSLSDLEALSRDARDPAALAGLKRRLDGDPRAGARALRERIDRRIACGRAERRRVRRLFALRKQLFEQGVGPVAGVDEVGVGPLAGPVVAAAVVLRERVDLPGLDDSKKLAAPVRERLAAQIREQAVAVGIGRAEVCEIDRLNILRATLLAMRRAVLALGSAPGHVLVDGRTIPDLGAPQTAIPGGDARDGSIAAASIVAKVYRDALMRRLELEHPGYGFVRHMGYATAAHLEALRRLGPSPVHRRSFAPVAQLPLL